MKLVYAIVHDEDSERAIKGKIWNEQKSSVSQSFPVPVDF